MNDTEKKQYVWLLSRIREGEVLFQLRCGDGYVANGLSQRGWHVSSSDHRDEMLAHARSYSSQHGLGSLFYNENTLSENMYGKYDVVIYVANEGLDLQLVYKAFKIAKIGGRMLLAYTTDNSTVWPSVYQLEAGGWYVQESFFLADTPARSFVAEVYRDAPFDSEERLNVCMLRQQTLNREDWRQAMHHVMLGHKVTVYTPAQDHQECITHGIRFLSDKKCEDTVCDLFYGQKPESVMATSVLP